MISMSEYLENIYVDFASDINEQTKLCQLKGLNFAAGCLPDYNNLQISPNTKTVLASVFLCIWI